MARCVAPSQAVVGRAYLPSCLQPVTRGGRQVGEWAWEPECVVPLGQGHSLRTRWGHRDSILALLYILRARCGRAGLRNGLGVIRYFFWTLFT